jgi:hypothetical protein
MMVQVSCLKHVLRKAFVEVELQSKEPLPSILGSVVFLMEQSCILKTGTRLLVGLVGAL